MHGQVPPVSWATTIFPTFRIIYKPLQSVYLYLLVLKKEFYPEVVPFLKYYHICLSKFGCQAIVYILIKFVYFKGMHLYRSRLYITLTSTKVISLNIYQCTVYEYAKVTCVQHSLKTAPVIIFNITTESDNVVVFYCLICTLVGLLYYTQAVQDKHRVLSENTMHTLVHATVCICPATKSSV